MKLSLQYSALVLLSLCTYLSTALSDEASPEGAPVTMVKAIQMTMVSSTLIRGEIESPSTPHIAAKVAAEIVSIKVDEGMRVQAGQLLAELDDEAFRIAEESANAAIRRLQALIENQQRELQRSKELIRKKLAAQSTLDDAITALKQSQAELAGTRAKRKEARYQLSHAKIISPVDGIIQQRTASLGDYVKSGDLLFQIVSTDRLRARLYFPETLANSIHLGMQVELTHGDKTVTGEVNRIRPMLEDSNRALHALVDFQNEGDWKPGSSIVARVILDQHADAVSVPEKALVRRPAGAVLYRIKDNIAIEQVITTGLKQGNMIEVISGLNAGASIVLDGAAWLTDGARVNVQGTAQ